jgi:tripartite-type tricarboxylate transporter receptor subunit TctC
LPSGAALADDWTPAGPITMMIGFAPGGGADTQARLIADALQQRHGWQVIPQNVPGRGGLNMAHEMMGAATDGTVFGLSVTETLGYNLAAAPDAGMQVSDFTGLITTAGFQMGVVARADRGWTTFADMIEEARGGGVRFGTMSANLSDLAYLLGEAQGVEFNIVEVQGGRAVMDGVNAGDMDVGFMAGIQARGVASGDLVNLASGLSTPLTQTPDAPTLGDLGVPFNADGYFLFFGPGGMDPAAREAIAAAIEEIVTDPNSEVNALLNRAFGGPTVITGAALDALIQNAFDASTALIVAAQ